MEEMPRPFISNDHVSSTVQRPLLEPFKLIIQGDTLKWSRAQIGVRQRLPTTLPTSRPHPPQANADPAHKCSSCPFLSLSPATPWRDGREGARGNFQKKNSPLRVAYLSSGQPGGRQDCQDLTRWSLTSLPLSLRPVSPGFARARRAPLSCCWRRRRRRPLLLPLLIRFVHCSLSPASFLPPLPLSLLFSSLLLSSPLPSSPLFPCPALPCPALSWSGLGSGGGSSTPFFSKFGGQGCQKKKPHVRKEKNNNKNALMQLHEK